MGVVDRVAVFEGVVIAELGEAAEVVADRRNFGKHPEPGGGVLCDQEGGQADVAGMLFLQVKIALYLLILAPKGGAVGGKPGVQGRQVGKRCSISHRASS